MPGLTNRRNAIREGTDWTKSKTKGYKYGGEIEGPVIAGGRTEIPGTTSAIKRLGLRTKGYKTGGKVKKSKKKGPSIKGKGYGSYTKFPSGTKS